MSRDKIRRGEIFAKLVFMVWFAFDQGLTRLWIEVLIDKIL
jgi:hypothetical protein